MFLVYHHNQWRLCWAHNSMLRNHFSLEYKSITQRFLAQRNMKLFWLLILWIEIHSYYPPPPLDVCILKCHDQMPLLVNWAFYGTLQSGNSHPSILGNFLNFNISSLFLFALNGPSSFLILSSFPIHWHSFNFVDFLISNSWVFYSTIIFFISKSWLCVLTFFFLF